MARAILNMVARGSATPVASKATLFHSGFSRRSSLPLKTASSPYMWLSVFIPDANLKAESIAGTIEG